MARSGNRFSAEGKIDLGFSDAEALERLEFGSLQSNSNKVVVAQIMQAWLTNLATVERRKAAEAPQWIRLSGFLGYLSS